jgi:hypothetical protein
MIKIPWSVVGLMIVLFASTARGQLNASSFDLGAENEMQVVSFDLGEAPPKQEVFFTQFDLADRQQYGDHQPDHKPSPVQAPPPTKPAPVPQPHVQAPQACTTVVAYSTAPRIQYERRGLFGRRVVAVEVDLSGNVVGERSSSQRRRGVFRGGGGLFGFRNRGC